MANLSVDTLVMQKSLIDLTSTPRNSFNSVFLGYDLDTLLDDIILAEFTDEGGSSNTISRNGIVVPVNADTQAWRIGKVILCGNTWVCPLQTLMWLDLARWVMAYS